MPDEMMLSPAMERVRFRADMDEAMNIVRLPTSEILFLINAYLELLEPSLADSLRQRMSNHDFAIRMRRCAKEAILLSTLKELFKNPHDVDTYLDELSASTADTELAQIRVGLVSMMLH